MTVKSVISIDVHDEAFKSFHELFEKYQTQLAQMPAGWRDIEKRIKKAGDAFSASVEGAKKLSEHIGKTAVAQNKFMIALHKSGLSMKSLGNESKKIAGHILNATRHLMKWASIASAVGGLIGIGGFFGLEDLASGVLNERRSARMERTTIGQKRAFDVNYKPYVNPGFLSAINAAASDINKSRVFLSMGMGNYQSMSTTQQAIGMINAIHRTFIGMPENSIEQFRRAYGLDQAGISIGEINSIVRARNLAGAEAAYNRDKHTMGLGAGTASAWQNFSLQLSRAGIEIKNVLVKGLTPLIPALTRFSELIIRDLIKELPNIESAVSSFVKFIGSPQFKKDMQTFARYMHDIAEGAEKTGRAISWGNKQLNAAGTNIGMRAADFTDWLKSDWRSMKRNTEQYSGNLEKWARMMGFIGNKKSNVHLTISNQTGAVVNHSVSALSQP